MARSVEQNVERSLFFRPFGLQRLAAGPRFQIAVLDLPADRRGNGIAHRIRAGLRLAGERGAGRRIERPLAAARGQPEQGGERADQGETKKRAVEKKAQEMSSLGW